jgi:hypothetical protein
MITRPYFQISDNRGRETSKCSIGLGVTTISPGGNVKPVIV